MLNYARKFLGLPEFTDQDLQIEGNNQGNNKPDKINGNQGTPKIKNGVANIEEYNKS